MRRRQCRGWRVVTVQVLISRQLTGNTILLQLHWLAGWLINVTY